MRLTSELPKGEATDADPAWLEDLGRKSPNKTKKVYVTRYPCREKYLNSETGHPNPEGRPIVDVHRMSLVLALTEVIMQRDSHELMKCAGKKVVLYRSS